MLHRTYHNGKFVNTEDLSLSGTDLGLHRGYGIFDFFKIRNRTSPYLDWYMDRLEYSLKRTRLSIHMTRQELLAIIDQLLTENDVEDAYLKIIVTAGYSPNGYTRTAKENVLLFAMPLPSSDVNSSTPSVLISDEYRREMPDVKTTNYIRSCMLQPEMDKAGAIDVLFYWNGYVSEASRSNIFVGKDGAFVTPGKDILKGITRQRVLRLEIPEIKISERDIELEEVFHADEIFITSSTKGIMPILKVDDKTIGNGEIGPMTERLMQEVNTF